MRLISSGRVPPQALPCADTGWKPVPVRISFCLDSNLPDKISGAHRLNNKRPVKKLKAES
jgi:hypothetical protein